MKKKLFLILALLACFASFSQFTTGGPINLGSSGMTIKIDTDLTTVTLALTGPSTTSLAIGFGGLTMQSVSDMFVWSSDPRRDYTSSGRNLPQPDADTDQSWNIVSDELVSTTRKIIATRALVSLGDYTFVNSSASIPIIYSVNGSTTFGQHGTKGFQTLLRGALGAEDFSLNSASIYPNPTNGNFVVEAKTVLSKITVYSQVGILVKTIELDSTLNKVDLNLKELSAGVYLLELQNDSDKAWRKIIIQ